MSAEAITRGDTLDMAHGRSRTPALPILIVTALAEELEPLRRTAPLLTFLSRLGSSPVIAACTGDGAQNASRGVTSLLRSNRFSALVGVGVAGSLSPELRVGDLIVAEEVRDGDGVAPPPELSLVERAVRAGARRGTLVTVRAPLVSSKGKAALGQRLGRNAVAAVDMESAAWARTATAAGVPYVVVRAITDGFDEDLPAFLVECLGDDGGMDRNRVARRALARPGSLIHLLGMRSRVRAGAGHLASFLEDFFRES
jgi:adenosylhomocysteine nucleosidase